MPVPPKRRWADIMNGTGLCATSGDLGRIGVSTFSITSYGVRAHIPIVESTSTGHTAAALSWFRKGIQLLGLLLSPSSNSLDPRVPHYKIGVAFYDTSRRLVPIMEQGGRFELFGKPSRVHWRDVYIAHRAPPGEEHGRLLPEPTSVLLGFGMNVPFWFSHRNLRQFLVECGNLRTAASNAKPSTNATSVRWTGSGPSRVSFEVKHSGGWDPAFQLLFGRCESHKRAEHHSGANPTLRGTLGQHWFRVLFPGETVGGGTHDCTKDHVSGWADLKTIVDLTPGLDITTIR